MLFTAIISMFVHEIRDTIATTKQEKQTKDKEEK